MNSVESDDTLLAEEDTRFLEEKGFRFSVTRDSGFICVAIRDYQLGAKYAPRTADILLRLPLSFPMAQPDMFWMYPYIQLVSGGYPPQADQFDVTFEGRVWQRWSRHLTSGQWRPGDSLKTFLGVIRSELQEGG